MSTTYDVEFRRPVTVRSVPQMSAWRLERAGLSLEEAQQWKGENDEWAGRRKSGVETRIVKVTRMVVNTCPGCGLPQLTSPHSCDHCYAWRDR